VSWSASYAQPLAEESVMIGALLVGFVAGVIARVLMPRDAFRKMSGPASWGVSILLGLAGALVGWLIFTVGMGIGDTDIFDWGGILGAVIGTLIVLAFANWFMRRSADEPAPAAPTAVEAPPAPPPAAPPPPVTEAEPPPAASPVAPPPQSPTEPPPDTPLTP
jgi:uncharacterized membrane protein YeaQ/YmgE (transglycosylase-associated protein family)